MFENKNKKQEHAACVCVPQLMAAAGLGGLVEDVLANEIRTGHHERGLPNAQSDARHHSLHTHR